MHPGEIGIKFGKLFVSNLWNLILLYTIWLPLFLFSFLKVESMYQEKLKKLVFLCFLFLIITLSFLESDSRFFLCLLPMTILFSVSLIYKSIPEGRRILVVGLIFIGFILQARIELKRSLALKIDQTFPEIVKYISNNTSGNTVILTDSPDRLSWYTNRRTIWLADINDIKTIQKKYVRIDGIVLSAAIQQLTSDPIVEQWKIIYTQHQNIDGFQLMHVFPDGSLWYVSQGKHD